MRPHFSEDEMANPVTVEAKRYHNMLSNFAVSKLMSCITITPLQTKFFGRIICRNSNIKWSA